MPVVSSGGLPPLKAEPPSHDQLLHQNQWSTSHTSDFNYDNSPLARYLAGAPTNRIVGANRQKIPYYVGYCVVQGSPEKSISRS